MPSTNLTNLVVKYYYCFIMPCTGLQDSKNNYEWQSQKRTISYYERKKIEDLGRKLIDDSSIFVRC